MILKNNLYTVYLGVAPCILLREQELPFQNTVLKSALEQKLKMPFPDFYSRAFAYILDYIEVLYKADDNRSVCR